MRASVDGRVNDISTGPSTNDGSMDITLYIRDHGESVEAMSIICRRRDDGTILIRAYTPTGSEIRVVSEM
jgi:hypothetical protein